MSLVVVTAPVQEPLGLTEVYDHLRVGVGVTTTPDDARLLRLIRAARERVETHTRRALCQQTLRYIMDERHHGPYEHGGGFGNGFRELPGTWWGALNAWWHRPRPLVLQHPPIQEVVGIQYYDVNNAQQSIDAGNYYIDCSAQAPQIEFIEGYVGPQMYNRADAVQITYVAGYAVGLMDDDVTPDYAANIPQTIKEAMLLLVENAFDVMLPAEELVIDARIDSMLANYRVERFS